MLKEPLSEAKLLKVLTHVILFCKSMTNISGLQLIVQLGSTQAEHRNYMLHALPWL